MPGPSGMPGEHWSRGWVMADGWGRNRSGRLLPPPAALSRWDKGDCTAPLPSALRRGDATHTLHIFTLWLVKRKSAHE